MNYTHGWIIVGFLPVLLDMPKWGVVAWAGALLLGTLIATGRMWRWVAVGWATSVAVPESSLFGIAASGYAGYAWADSCKAALLGTVVGLLTIPGLVRQAGLVLLVAACLIAVAKGTRR